MINKNYYKKILNKIKKKKKKKKKKNQIYIKK